MSVQLAGTTGSAHFEGLVKEQVSDRSSPASVPAPRAVLPEGLPRDHGHAAAVVGTERELLDATLRFLDAGLRAGDLVALTCPPETVDLLTRELGERAAALESEPRLSLLGARAPDAMTMCQRYLQRAMATGSGRLRGVAQGGFGSQPADWREGQRFESVYNRLLGDAPVAAICVYDRRRVPGPAVRRAGGTHPILVQGDTWSVSPGFQDPGAYVPSLPLPREPVEAGEPVFAVADAPTLAGL